MEEYAGYVDINLGVMAVSCQRADPLRKEGQSAEFQIKLDLTSDKICTIFKVFTISLSKGDMFSIYLFFKILSLYIY